MVEGTRLICVNCLTHLIVQKIGKVVCSFLRVIEIYPSWSPLYCTLISFDHRVSSVCMCSAALSFFFVFFGFIFFVCFFGAGGSCLVGLALD